MNTEKKDISMLMRITPIVPLLVLAAWPPLVTFSQEPRKTERTLLQDQPNCRVQIELVDAASGSALPGVLRALDKNGQRVAIPELMPRGLGVPEQLSIHDWYLLPMQTTVTLPRKILHLRAFHGLETEFTDTAIDLRNKTEAQVRLQLKRFHDAHGRGWQSANTHVHLQKVSRSDSEKYLLDVANCEQLDIVYISYLERAEADLEYTTNKYTRDDLRRLMQRSRTSHSHPHSIWHGTEFDNGQEHRHNFDGFDEGYGHVMFLHLNELVQPVSIGPGITKRGTDSPPLQLGIDLARGQGSTIIWCHNQWGMEDIPSWLAGKLHANNIFDGGTHGSFKYSFYRYLNAGLKVPFSTGTDWFIYDFSRVYALADPRSLTGDKWLSSEQWLEHLAAGRTFITNGPLLEFTVNGHRLGDTLNLPHAGPVKILGRSVGRDDFQQIQLVRNGEVVKSASSNPREGHFEAEFEFDLTIDAPCWLALRTPPPSVPKDAEFQRKTPLNEFGRELFSHTSAIYIHLAGRDIFDVSAAESLLEEMRSSRDLIRSRSLFSNDAERDGVLAIYDAGINQMEKNLKSRRIP
ncbi:MAG TPA: CehA/McbA family metallohydrolase [Pirellula sp.]|nr:CehA/McbA family metallohydrolase [Pirellula sp.]